jgi:MYXO-CTERM domain-containing protein
MPRLPRLHAAAAAAAPFALALLAGCSAAGGPEVPEGLTHGEVVVPESQGAAKQVEAIPEALNPIARSQAIAFAEEWVAAKLQYCQSPNGQPDPDTACSSTCVRTSNPQWDPYRSDCSGFVSWAWQLPAPGRVTSTFAPFDTTVSSVIACSDLKPGDAANRDSGGHMVLFKEWVTPGTEAIFIEEPGCSSSQPYAHEFTSAVTCSGNDVDIAYEGTTFRAIRYDHIVDDVPDAGGAPPDAGHGHDAAAPGSDAGAHGADAATGGAGGTGGTGGATGGAGGAGGAPGTGGTGGAAGDNAGAGTSLDATGASAGCAVSAGSSRGASLLGGLVMLGVALASRRRRRS